MAEPRHLVLAGATGWIGSAVRAAAARRGIPTTSLSTRLEGSAPAGWAGLRDIPAVLDSDSVVLNAVGRTAGSPRELDVANVELCLLLARACLEAGAAFVTVGSAAEYGDPGSPRISERDVERPVDAYGASKLAATRQVQSLREQEGLVGTVARVFNVVGAGRPGVSPVTDVAAGVRALTPAGGSVRARDSSLVRDFSTIDWVANRLIDLSGRAGVFDTVNVCSGRATSYRLLIHAMAAERGVEAQVVDTSPGGLRRVVGDPARLRLLLPDVPRESLRQLAQVALRQASATVAAS